ncbi:MAG: hypothetical protein JXA10_12110 [Anaerolineae bacterium]|nr:hypothetical protein [Anaerolineae bacterium]
MDSDHAPLTADDLARLFGFTLDDLALNRTGQFSAQQRQTLIFRSVGYLVRGVGLDILLIILGAYVTTLIHSAWEWALFGLLCVSIAVIMGLWIKAMYQIIAHPTIHTLIGPLRRAGDANHPLILAGDVQLRVSFRRWKRLADAYPGQYRFYIGPEQALLSIEPLHEEIII